MPKFLLNVQTPNDYDPSTEGPAVMRAIDAVNDEMVAKGVRVYVGGLHHPSGAKTVSRDTGGSHTVTDGLSAKSDQYVRGLWVIEAADMEEAVEWGKKAAAACCSPIEVRQFH